MCINHKKHKPNLFPRVSRCFSLFAQTTKLLKKRNAKVILYIIVIFKLLPVRTTIANQFTSDNHQIPTNYIGVLIQPSNRRSHKQ